MRRCRLAVEFRSRHRRFWLLRCSLPVRVRWGARGGGEGEGEVEDEGKVENEGEDEGEGEDESEDESEGEETQWRGRLRKRPREEE